MKRAMKVTLIVALCIVLLWLLLTLWAQFSGNKSQAIHGNGTPQILLVYNPDPIYNLDQQVCTAMAKGFEEKGISSRVSTTRWAESDSSEYLLYVLCANTYNWAPDWQISRLAQSDRLSGKNVVALTLGSGSTASARRKLESHIKSTGAALLDSREFWLMKPNDDENPDAPNVETALHQAKQWALELADSLSIE